jgi:CubicO group peptidase (beta-lactamase class C family)
MTVKNNYCILLALLLSTSTFGQVLNKKKLDSLLNILDAKGMAMGSLVISRNGKVEYQKAIGYRYIDTLEKKPNTTETKYRIGSVSKMFTAVMILQLVEENKIQLSQTLASFFPGIPNADKITIRDMLYHRSGLHDYTNNTGFDEWKNKPKTQGEMLEVVARATSDFAAGSKNEYCNTNYLLLGYIIEKVCNMPYRDALEKRIVSRLALKNTYYGGMILAESTSYKFLNKGWEKQNSTNLEIHGGAGSIISNPTDMVQFIESLFAYKLVNKENLDKMQTMIGEYGMGLFSNKYGSKPSFGHNGRIEEFYSALWHFPNENLSFAYCTNGIAYPRIDIIEGVLKICFGERYEIPFSKISNSGTEDLNAILGQYSSTEMPMVVNCTKDGDKLLLETKGHTFETTRVAPNYFMNADFGYFFEFIPSRGELLIKETDNVYYLSRTK